MTEIETKPTAPPPELPPNTDGTLTVGAHVTAVATGAIIGALVHLGLPVGVEPYVSIVVGALVTTAVHFIEAKLNTI
jgi:hypothetical protein